ncbi:MAG TPA: serine hydrolase [Gemmatimonadaceae bacterium]|nr:serine hydrolase [Gemmatimonadaceae bacterium]
MTLATLARATRVFVLAALPCLTLRAQSIANNDRVKQATELLKTWLEAQRAYEQIPGISAGVVYDQELVWSGGYGFADISRQAPATASTIYSICSISKLFTSIAVMQQRDANRLRLDDPVAKHLPWMTIKSSYPESGDITIEGLLTHASGLPRESDHPYWTGPEFPFPTREEIRERLSGQTTLYPAETFFQYSNLGLALAGEVAATAAGMPYADLVTRNILNPLGMSSTTPEIPTAERGKRFAMGYSAIMREGGRKPVPFFQTRGIAPAAGFASTVEDLAKFASWQFRLLGKGGTEILKANTLREMQRVHWVDPDFETTWGLGFTVWRSDNKTFVGHGGSCPGFRTQLLLKPDEKIATIMMANALGVNPSVWAQRVYEIMSPALRAAAKPAGAAAVSTTGSAPPPVMTYDASLDRYLGTYGSTFGGELAVVRWEDGLSILSLPTMDPVRSLMKMRKTGEHTFRRVRRDEALGEEIVFEMGPDGKPTRFRQHQNYYARIR